MNDNSPELSVGSPDPYCDRLCDFGFGVCTAPSSCCPHWMDTFCELETGAGNHELLKPCPFCGADVAKVADWSDVDGKEYWVFCQQCAAATGHCETREGAIEAWNRRANHGN